MFSNMRARGKRNGQTTKRLDGAWWEFLILEQVETNGRISWNMVGQQKVSLKKDRVLLLTGWRVNSYEWARKLVSQSKRVAGSCAVKAWRVLWAWHCGIQDNRRKRSWTVLVAKSSKLDGCWVYGQNSFYDPFKQGKVFFCSLQAVPAFLQCQNHCQ